MKKSPVAKSTRGTTALNLSAVRQSCSDSSTTWAGAGAQAHQLHCLGPLLGSWKVPRRHGASKAGWRSVQGDHGHAHEGGRRASRGPLGWRTRGAPGRSHRRRRCPRTSRTSSSCSPPARWARLQAGTMVVMPWQGPHTVEYIEDVDTRRAVLLASSCMQSLEQTRGGRPDRCRAGHHPITITGASGGSPASQGG